MRVAQTVGLTWLGIGVLIVAGLVLTGRTPALGGMTEQPAEPAPPTTGD